jgi:hypothetical protein
MNIRIQRYRASNFDVVIIVITIYFIHTMTFSHSWKSLQLYTCIYTTQLGVFHLEVHHHLLSAVDKVHQRTIQMQSVFWSNSSFSVDKLLLCLVLSVLYPTCVNTQSWLSTCNLAACIILCMVKNAFIECWNQNLQDTHKLHSHMNWFALVNCWPTSLENPLLEYITTPCKALNTIESEYFQSKWLRCNFVLCCISLQRYSLYSIEMFYWLVH